MTELNVQEEKEVEPQTKGRRGYSETYWLRKLIEIHAYKSDHGETIRIDKTKIPYANKLQHIQQMTRKHINDETKRVSFSEDGEYIYAKKLGGLPIEDTFSLQTEEHVPEATKHENTPIYDDIAKKAKQSDTGIISIQCQTAIEEFSYKDVSSGMSSFSYAMKSRGCMAKKRRERIYILDEARHDNE